MAQLRALVCGDFSSLIIPHSRQCADALEALGCDVVRVDSEDRRRKLPEMLKRWSKSLAKRLGLKQVLSEFYVRRELSIRNSRVRSAFDSHNPNIVLVVRGNSLDPALLSYMRSQGAHLIGWWIKDIRRPQNLRHDVPHYDAYYCIHRNLSQGAVRYLPAWCIDSSRYYPADLPVYKHDIVFVGIWNPKRQAFLDALTSYDLAIVGPGWNTRTLSTNPALARKVFKTSLHGEELTRFYQSARIVLNINQWEADEASGTTLRVADVPACGSFLLTEYSRGLEELFEANKEIVTFSTPTEMKEKVDYYLSHDEERTCIALAGLTKTRQLPTPKERMTHILENYFLDLGK